MVSTPRPIAGIHHVTAIARDPAANVDFYQRVLGLRLVKKTVNFDDPGTYHLYYGNTAGEPGTVLTFFPWPLARRGTPGYGQATVTQFSVPAESLSFWEERLDREGVDRDVPMSRMDERVLCLRDPDGLALELVAHQETDTRSPWSGGTVPDVHAIRGFFGVELLGRSPDETVRLLEHIGFRVIAEDGRRTRLRTGAGPGGGVDLRIDAGAPPGVVAAGSVHHVAWRVSNDEDQAAWSRHLAAFGSQPTPVLDRRYFRSIYFREPGGTLFEMATDPPGFTLDEKQDALGTELKLPPWLEGDRARIEALLPPLERIEPHV
jgi:glyoxalase family protein